MGTAAARQAAFQEGRLLWSDKKLEQETQRYAVAAGAAGATPTGPQGEAVAAQAHRLAMQRHTRAVHAAAKQVAELLKAPGTMGQALIIGLDALQHVAFINFDPGRIAAAAESKRRQRRIVDKTASDILAFTAERTHTDPSPARNQRFPPRTLQVIVAGNWLAGSTSRNFPMKKTITKLARECIFQYASETMTTSACNLCGDLHQYPSKQNGEKASGSVQCANPACPGKRAFFNRDTSAASGICKRWIYRYMFGGELGAVFPAVPRLFGVSRLCVGRAARAGGGVCVLVAAVLFFSPPPANTPAQH
jgi:hypothetical protein